MAPLDLIRLNQLLDNKSNTCIESFLVFRVSIEESSMQLVKYIHCILCVYLVFMLSSLVALLLLLFSFLYDDASAKKHEEYSLSLGKSPVLNDSELSFSLGVVFWFEGESRAYNLDFISLAWCHGTGDSSNNLVWYLCFMLLVYTKDEILPFLMRGCREFWKWNKDIILCSV